MKSNLKSEEIVSVIKDNMLGNAVNDFSEAGKVLRTGDGIADVYGLEFVGAGEMLEFESGVRGVALNLRKGVVGAIIFGDNSEVSEGDSVVRLFDILSIPVGNGLLGRVVNVLGDPIDGLGKFEGELVKSLIDVKAPGILSRKPVHEPLQTGLKVLDAIVPIGRGQRELIIGDRQTGKTAVALDTMINQKLFNDLSGEFGVNTSADIANIDPSNELYSVYVGIGQKMSTIIRIVNILKKTGCMAYCVIVIATAAEGAPSQYIAPFSGTAIAEYFRDNGKHCLIVYDDLSKHAVAYRQMCLLLRRPPGREAFPGDVFYLHSRLLERGAKMSTDKGSGSLTAFPVIETQDNDVSAYIATNVISITDGQIFLESGLFNKGVRPALSAGLSVSRVGSAAQVAGIKKLASSLKLELAQYRDLASFEKFGASLDEETKGLLVKGAKISELMKQGQYNPLSVASQILVIFSGVEGFLKTVDIKMIDEFEKGLLKFVSKSEYLVPFMDSLNVGDKLDNKILSRVVDYYVSYEF